MMLEILAENRDLVEIVRQGERMLRDIDLKKLPSFQLGFETGKEEGIEHGMQQGERKAKLGIAKKLLKDGFDKEFVIKITGLNKEDLDD